jgi:hypothetical protein
MSNIILHPSSYRDPSGFIFEKNGILYRQVNTSFKEHFDHFIESGCYDQLVKKGLIIPHKNIEENFTRSSGYYKTISPERIELISYPYEWPFDMLKDAALLTLQLVKEALRYNMILKDASPYNIQWHKGKLIFIDTLSFEKYEEAPWIAYRQFCENFLGPLLIMHYSKQQLPELMLSWPNGIPLTTIRSLLPTRSRFSLHTYLHIHLHARIAGKKNHAAANTVNLSKQKLVNLITSLEILIKRLKTPVQITAWSAYYDEAGQRGNYLEQKKKIVGNWINEFNDIGTAADLGANDGEFSGLLAEKSIDTIAADMDPYCINSLYNKIRTGGNKNIQPVIVDLSNPTPAIGVNNEERSSFVNRAAGADLLLALALIHHLAIGKNIPFDMIAEMLDRMGKKLIIEFVPKTDAKIQWMLSRKKDIYSSYTEENFIKAFERYFTTIEKKTITGSGRILFLMKRNEG